MLPPGELVILCRTLRHQLGAGLPIVRVLRQQSERGPGGVRRLAGRLLTAVETGEALGAAMARETGVLPPLFIAMGQLADETGHLPEVLAELERYYQLESQLRKRFRSQSILPVLQFLFAVGVVAGLLFVLGLLAGSGKPLLTFFGLGGSAGALAFLTTVTGVIASAVLLWVLLRRAATDRLLLRVPVLGPCLEALALGRLALALQLTLDSGLPIGKALRLSLRATGNPAYAAAADDMVRVLKTGHTLHEALAAARLFPTDFLEIVVTAEEAGRVPEAMRQQAEYYHEEAARRLRALAQAASFALWLVYAGFVIWMIFRIANVYLQALKI